jgi:anti-sigma factor RsiW
VRDPKVSCEEIRGLLSDYTDGELDLVRELEIEQHLRECPICAGVVERSRSLSKMYRDPALYPRPPADLHRRVRLSLRQATGARERDHLVSRRWACLGGFAAAAALALAALWGARQLKPALSRDLKPAVSRDERVAQEVINSHLRSVKLANYSRYVESRDPQTANPWLISNVGYVPEVKDLTQQGFPLLGCRLEFVADRPAAIFLYTHTKHVINVSVWRAEEREKDRTSEFLEQQGYHLIRWTDKGRLFWVTSDLNEKELGEFAELLRR